MGRLDDKVAIIVGVSSDTGKVSAELFVKEGANIVIADSDIKVGQKITENIKLEGGKALFKNIDIKDIGGCKDLVDFTLENHGKIGILVINVDNEGDLDYDIMHMDQKNLKDVLETNVIGT